jgi:hypothetical protein
MKSPDHSDDGLLSYDYDCDELNCYLTCWFEYEPADRGARERGTGLQLEPDYPATWSLQHAYLPNSDVDLAPVMRDSMIGEIETSVADHSED